MAHIYRTLYPILLTVFALFGFQTMVSQCVPPGTGSGETCQDPIDLCAGSIPLSTCGFAPDPPLVFCGGAAGTHNNSFTEFVAAGNTVSFEFTLLNCTMGLGVQAIIVQAIQGDCNNLVELACFNPPGSAQDFTITANVTPGETYLLMIDGYAGDCCNFDVVHSGVETNPPSPPVPNIDAPDIVCGPAANNVTFTVTNPDPGADYIWYEPSWVNQTGSSITVDLSGYIGQTLTFCVEAAVPCVPECSCTDIIVATEPQILINQPGPITCDNPTVTIDASGSDSGAGLTINWTASPGNIVSGGNTLTPVVDQAGTYTLTITSDAGCESEESVIIEEFTTPPTVTIDSEVIDCNNPTANVAAMSNPPNLNYFWSGPNGFTGIGAVINVSTPGLYTVTVEDNYGCETIESGTVEIDTVSPDVSATGGLINCYNPTIMIMGNSNTPGVTYEWQGPQGFTSTEQNPVVDVPGGYVLTVTAPNGCTNMTFAEVEGDFDPPFLEAEGGDITCTESEVTLDATSYTPGVTYQWTGPAGFTSTQEDPTVSVLGTYTVVATNPANGCTAEVSVFVNDVRVYPTVIANGGMITCDNEDVTFDVTSTPSTVTYEWTGPFGFTSNEQNPTVDEPGNYSVTVTTFEGCSTTVDVQVGIDVTPPIVTASGGQLSCQLGSIVLFANSNTGITYEWTGPNGYESDEIAPTVSTPGTYTVVVTAANGCTADATAEVTQDDDVPQVEIDGENITCLNSMALLQGSTNEPGAFFTWTGPNGFTSGSPSPTVTNPGIYTLTVTAPNGCEGTAEFNVQDESIEPDIQLTADTISCTNTSVTIDLVSSIDSLSFEWTGPDNFSSTEEDPEITMGGTYNVTVTSNGGCVNDDQISVPVDTLAPQINLVADSITCQADTITIQTTSNRPVDTYFWTGPNGFSSYEEDPSVFTSGMYVLTVIGTNNCETLDSIEVFADVNLPDVQAQGDTLSCSVNQIQLTGSSSVPGATYAWSGPNGFSSNQQNPFAGEVGTYTLTVTAPNGCRATTTADVTIDDSIPEAMAQGGTLTCADDTITVQGSTSTPNASFGWSGPNGFSSTDQNPQVSMGGMYVFTVTSPNGCSSTDTIQVAEDFAAPDVQAQGGIITCQDSEVELQSSSGTPGVTFTWSGPGGFTSTDASPMVNTAGMYTVEATGPNGCTATTTVEVEIDAGVPMVEAEGENLDCNNQQTTLEGNSNLPNVDFNWTGPNGFTSTEQNPLVDVGGAYTLTVEAPNGCTSTATVFIEEDFAQPDISAVGDTVTCANPNGTLTGQSTTQGVSYSWTGPGGFTSTQASPAVTTPGTYTLEVTAPNGCVSTTDVELEADENVPDVTADGGEITCVTTEVQLQANSQMSGITYNWTGPGGFTSNQQNPLVDQPGDYTVMVAAPNGCTNSDEVNVADDTQTPDLQVSGGELNCQVFEVELESSTSTPGITLAWSGPNGFTSQSPSPLVTEPGSYTLTALNPGNGCMTTQTAMVTEDTLRPTDLDLDIYTPSCVTDVGSIVINGVVGGHAPYSYSTDGGNTFLSSTTLEDLPPGDYTILVQDNIGCEYEEQINIPDLTELEAYVDPEIFIELGESAQIEVETNIPENQIANIIWEPSDFLSCTDCLNPVSTPDRTIKYKVTVIDINGCSDTELITVIPEFDPGLYIPNVFSPKNQDGINDIFYIFGNADKIVEIKAFEIYDRWGEMVHSGYNFEPNDPSNGWDGTLQGEKMNPGVFIYRAEVEFINGEIREYKGDVTVIN